MKKLTLFLLAGLLLLLGSACTNTTKVIAGDLKVALVSIQREASGNVQITWRVDNPNVVSYLISTGTHKIILNGSLIGTVVSDKPLGIPANTQMERTTLLTPAGPEAEAVIAKASAQGSATYRVESVIMLLILDDKYEKVHLTYTGNVPVMAK